MYANVFFQVLRKSKTLTTIRTVEWSLVGVDHLVSVEVLQQGEPFATRLTLVRPSIHFS